MNQRSYIEGLRITMRCDQGHEETFEVAAFAAWIPVYCPSCPWNTLWSQVGETQKFDMEIREATVRAATAADARDLFRQHELQGVRVRRADTTTNRERPR